MTRTQLVRSVTDDPSLTTLVTTIVNSLWPDDETRVSYFDKNHVNRVREYLSKFSCTSPDKLDYNRNNRSGKTERSL